VKLRISIVVAIVALNTMLVCRASTKESYSEDLTFAESSHKGMHKSKSYEISTPRIFPKKKALSSNDVQRNFLAVLSPSKSNSIFSKKELTPQEQLEAAQPYLINFCQMYPVNRNDHQEPPTLADRIKEKVSSRKAPTEEILDEIKTLYRTCSATFADPLERTEYRQIPPEMEEGLKLLTDSYKYLDDAFLYFDLSRKPKHAHLKQPTLNETEKFLAKATIAIKNMKIIFATLEPENIQEWPIAQDKLKGPTAFLPGTMPQKAVAEE